MRLVLASIALFTSGACVAADGFYLGATGGTLELAWDTPTAVGLPVIPPPILHSVCGGTATIQYGAGNDIRTSYEDNTESGIAPVLGWRRGRFALELAFPPRAESLTVDVVVAGDVTQPTCTTTPTATVQAFTSVVERIAIEHTSLAALYEFELRPKVRLQLRAQVAAWDATREVDGANMVVEDYSGLLVDVPLSASSGSSRDDGVDAGFGVGIAVALREGFDLRFGFSQQTFGKVDATGFSFGFVYGF